MTVTQTVDLLNRGLKFHRLGDLEQAGRAYREILAANPQRADALHLLGVVIHQLGDSLSAAEAITRAIALHPNAAHFHANLGEVYKTLGDHRRAVGCFTLALSLRPDRFESSKDFDILLQSDQNLDSLPWPTPRPRPLAPEAAMDLTDLAMDLRARGDLDGAVDRFAEALRMAPEMGELHVNLGLSLLEVHRREQALFHAQEAVRLAPDLPEARNLLGNVLKAMGRSTESKASYLEALRLDPSQSSAHQYLGKALIDDRWPSEAMTWLHWALNLDPRSASIRLDLANALKNLDRLDEAVTRAEEAIRLEPHLKEAHLCLGSIRHEQGRFEDASAAFRRAIELDPGYALAHHDLGLILTEMGDFASAEASFHNVIRLPGDHSRALVGLTTLLRGKVSDATLAAILERLADPDLIALRRADLHFVAAMVFDTRGDFARSAEHLRLGNAIKAAENLRTGRDYRPEGDERFLEEIIRVCTSEFFERVAAFGSSSVRPIFIFGLPRTGTTLTEQILASHSRVRGLGELQMARSSFVSLPERVGSTRYPVECLERIDRETTSRMALDYLDRLKAIDDRSPMVVDKMPDNFQYLGYLATLFPRANFIHCRRDLRDTAVSCWSTNFWDVFWSNKVEDIATRFGFYQRTMNHWNRVLPVPILDVDYEATVADPEATARKLMEWCDLEWEPGCLAFHESRRVVRTASVTQVRQPVYKHAVDRWRNYENELGSLFDRLPPQPGRYDRSINE